MSSVVASCERVSPKERLDVLFDELAELAGQRNAIDGRIVEIVAEIDRDGIWGHTGCRSVAALTAWRLGLSESNARAVAAIAHRIEEFPRCTQALREGQLSVDQVAVIAARAADGSDAHYAQLASVATVSQLRTAVSLEPRPEPPPYLRPERAVSKIVGQTSTKWRITLPHDEAATFEAALGSHRDALIADWKRDHDTTTPSTSAPPLPNSADAFMSLIEAGWDADVARRPHGQHTTVVVHVDVEHQVGALHLGPALSEAERQYLSCDATCEVWFERAGQPIGAGRATRTVNRRLRRALEHRDRTCVVPGCGATRGLHAHHIQHWEDGGPTDLTNLVLVCPYHHRQHHRGALTITGTATHLTITDQNGQPLTAGSLARAPQHQPPQV
ncbi:HNH endonuclease signature motif containing protein, partial [Mycobacterium sp. shizuoka-1]|uniref:HNH endonuclease signature motif containing protein n=1 Tax=Mycobacterium sp. shizuoka-1 TaxID=2039281 RepID=UPI001E342347